MDKEYIEEGEVIAAGEEIKCPNCGWKLNEAKEQEIEFEKGEENHKI